MSPRVSWQRRASEQKRKIRQIFLFCLIGILKGGGLDRELSKSEKSKAGVYRNWVEEYFWDLHQYLKHRKDRRMALENYIQSSHMSETDKQKARREWFVKETALLRRRRVKVFAFAKQKEQFVKWFFFLRS